MMPEMDGVALIKAALEIDPHLIPILMTGSGSNESATEAKKVGAFDYVLKPFRMKRLIPVLKRALHTRHLAAEDAQVNSTLVQR
jgi:DNA-binding NtrC family response regulator